MFTRRLRLLYLFFLFSLAAVILRLSYWQLVQGARLKAEARSQHESHNILTPTRGEIITADGYPLVYNRPLYNLTAYTPHLDRSPEEIVNLILPLLTFDLISPTIATDPAALATAKEQTRINILDRLTNRSYAVLARGLSEEEKHSLQALALPGLAFEEEFTRGYPEASLSAQLLGFVGRDAQGETQGYFGLEGYYDRELRGRSGFVREERDGVGNPLLAGDYLALGQKEGRTLRLHLDRGIQYLVETELKNGLLRYGASAGEIIILEPKTGGILAMASFPTYDPAKFYDYDPELYKQPSIAASYEPGSVFKLVGLAASLEEKAITLTDRCDICSQPLPIGPYEIKTWNNEYHPSSTPEEILVNSDNIGMVWMTRRLGGEKFLTYLNAFGFGAPTGVDLQEEISPPLRSHWGEIDYATASFGQGIAVTSLQMINAVAAIANQGQLMEPHVVAEVLGQDSHLLAPKKVRQVISPETAAIVTNLMISAADHGDAKWTRLPDHTVAGKTGTAQIPVQGHYDEERTIASFVGFAPALNPKFVMLVKLVEPTSSPWGSETAAPLWFTLARRLLTYFQVPADGGSARISTP